MQVARSGVQEHLRYLGHHLGQLDLDPGRDRFDLLRAEPVAQVQADRDQQRVRPTYANECAASASIAADPPSRPATVLAAAMARLANSAASTVFLFSLATGGFSWIYAGGLDATLRRTVPTWRANRTSVSAASASTSRPFLLLALPELVGGFQRPCVPD